MARAARPFPFERLPKYSRADVVMLRRAARTLPLATLARIDTAWLGAPLAIDGQPIETCPRGELRHCISDPLVAAILEPPSPRGTRVAIEIEPRLAAIVIDRVLGGTGSDAPLDPGALTDAERGVLAYAIARAIAGTGGALRLATIVTSPAALALALGDGAAVCWPARVRLGADAGIVRAWIPEAALDRADANPQMPAELLASLAATIVLEAGRASLAASDVEALALGDVVVLDEMTARREAGALRGEVRARVRGGSTRWRCTIEDDARVVVRAIEAGRPGARPKESMMKEDVSKKSEAMLRTAADASIELVVELARFEVPLGELASLGPGEVLATGRAIGDRVVLRAGERAIAKGELVEIEGEIGVRVLELLHP